MGQPRGAMAGQTVLVTGATAGIGRATANALHPGLTRTSFGADDPAGVQRRLVPMLRPFMQAPAKGAATSIHLAPARARAGDRPLLRQPQTQAVRQGQL